MSPDGGTERRRSTRVARTFVVKYHWINEGRSTWGVSQTKDLSACGLRFMADRQFPVGTVLELEIRLSTATQPIRVKGQVMWSKPTLLVPTAEHGVEFTKLDEETTRALTQAVEFFTHRHPGGPPESPQSPSP